MIIAIWLIGIMMIWMFNMLVFNLKGYWTINSYMAWCVVWSMIAVIYIIAGRLL